MLSKQIQFVVRLWSFFYKYTSSSPTLLFTVLIKFFIVVGCCNKIVIVKHLMNCITHSTERQLLLIQNLIRFDPLLVQLYNTCSIFIIWIKISLYISPNKNFIQLKCLTTLTWLKQRKEICHEHLQTKESNFSIPLTATLYKNGIFSLLTVQTINLPIYEFRKEAS